MSTTHRPPSTIDRAIVVWRFQDAPKHLRGMSTNGGDEDWLAHLPRGMDVPTWMDAGSPFGCCDTQTVLMPDGSTVVIGSHA